MKTKITSGQQLKAHIRSLRKRKKWTQQILAAQMGVSQSRIVQIERNPNLVSFDQLLHLFNILGVSMSLELDNQEADENNESLDAKNKLSAAVEVDSHMPTSESKQAKW